MFVVAVHALGGYLAMGAHIQKEKLTITLHNHNLAKENTVTEMTLIVSLCFSPKCTCSHSQISLHQAFRTSTALCCLKRETHPKA